MNALNVPDFTEGVNAMSNFNYKNMNEILSFVLPIISINEMDLSRLIELWKKCTLSHTYDPKYGRENICEDILIVYKKNPWFVIYIIFELLDVNEKRVLNITTWEEFVDNSMQYITSKKINEINECMLLTETLRNSLVSTDVNVNEEKIIQNVAFKKYVSQKLWLSIYNLYKKIDYKNVILKHLSVPLNSVEIQKYEMIWHHLQNLQNVDEIPKDFWNWLSTDKLRTHLSRYHIDNPLQITKNELIDLLFNTQHIEPKYANQVSNFNNAIRSLNAQFKPAFLEHIKNNCGILDDYEQLYKLFDSEECKKLITILEDEGNVCNVCNVCEKLDNLPDAQLYYKLYLCIYKKNVDLFVENKTKYIQKRFLENILIKSLPLNFSLENNKNITLDSNQMFESIKDFYLSQDITNKWFINTFRGFKDDLQNNLDLCYKFRCANYYTSDYLKYIHKDVIFPENWKRYSKKFETYNNIGVNIFELNEITFCVVKIGNKYNSSYMYPATYSELLNKMLDSGEVYTDKKYKIKRTERALYILSTILYKNISNYCVLYKFTNTLINDDDVIELR